MAWVAVDKDGAEAVFGLCPEKCDGDDFWSLRLEDGCYVNLPQGAIERLIGRPLTWDDEPVELTEATE